MVSGKNGVVATDQTECSIIGRDVLKKGGHAADAAVAATLCVGVVSPIDSGLGGGGFILVRLANGEAKVFDMREIAPGRASKLTSTEIARVAHVPSMWPLNVELYNAQCLLGRRNVMWSDTSFSSPISILKSLILHIPNEPDMFSKMTRAERKHSPLAIGVPGQLAGLYTIHQKYGKLPWELVVKPAENLARRGFKVSQSLFNKMVNAESTIMSDEDLRSVFAPYGEILAEGQTLRLRKLADTLAAIAKHGMKDFYNGSIADSLATYIQQKKGIITKEDFQRYRVIVREPLVTRVLGHRILTVPPPASGGAVVISVVIILKTLSKYNNKGVTASLLVHRTIEALKYALALRMRLGDPGFVNISSALNSMISDNTAERVKNLINDNRTFDPPHYRSKWAQLNDHGTSHLCIVDRDRNVITMTTSINTKWGSRIMSPSTGIFLNNQMYDFSVPTSKGAPGAPANYVSAYKRPLSSMAPIILEKEGRVRAVIGSAGGILIPDAVSQLYPNKLLYEKYTSFSGDEYIYPSATISELSRKGHTVSAVTAMTTCQFVIQRLKGNKSGLLVAISDPRKSGYPAAY
ncbi:PREDICTED: gamma-glutamyltranspeptidase 1-like [Erythranthe guttata]|uniref:gamma-glutamyltranspeptidase 1-like n=1 Tax=Erythranthe guttata TaxID=4155 RepID=UPI00064DB217|nr:PREDICTED: gamma-glutamyltranspeptidase 1-like [Erythranthe guttata]|eukprot:XP_012831092.1 PREDICTED: gamma-glutamyltranspeptidase 1-like [Erythranthe guttata]